jgi:Phosphotransferase enzyme family
MSLARWTTTDFHDEVRTWVAEQLADRGMRLTGEWEQPHARPWSSALRFETTDGRVWFKVNGPGTLHEASLVRLIDARVPGLVPEVLAVDTARGWSVSRDGGPMLRETATPEQLWPAWEGIVARYAEAQLRLAEAGPAVLAAGVAEASPATVPALLEELTGELAAVPVDQGGLTAEETDGLAAMQPKVSDWCSELAAIGVPDSVQHDDLHSGNVCWGGSVASARIIDWGDTTWGSPLGTMLGTLNSIAWHAGLFGDDGRVDAPEVVRVRDAYLEPFTAYVDRATLVRGVHVARRTGCVGKALSYRAALTGAPLAAHREMEFPVRAWLLELLTP